MLVFCFYSFLMLLCCWHCLFVLSLVLCVGYYCCFCHAILVALSVFLHYFYTLLLLTFPLLFRLFFTLLILSGYHSFHVATLFALLFLPCYSSHTPTPLTLLLLSCCFFCIVAPFTFQAIASQRLLLFSHYHSWSFYIVALMFCLINIVLPLPLPCASQSSKVSHQLKHQMWILLHIFKFFELLLLLLFCFLLCLFYFFFCCCYFCNFSIFFSTSFCVVSFHYVPIF